MEKILSRLFAMREKRKYLVQKQSNTKFPELSSDGELGSQICIPGKYFSLLVLNESNIVFQEVRMSSIFEVEFLYIGSLNAEEALQIFMNMYRKEGYQSPGANHSPTILAITHRIC